MHVKILGRSNKTQATVGRLIDEPIIIQPKPIGKKHEEKTTESHETDQ